MDKIKKILLYGLLGASCLIVILCAGTDVPEALCETLVMALLCAIWYIEKAIEKINAKSSKTDNN